MPTVLSVGKRRTAPVLLTLCCEGESEPRGYGITEREYLALGSPAVGDTLTEEEAERLAALDERHRARAAAARILAAGDNSVSTLAQKLRARGFPAALSAEIAADMAQRGYIREGDQLERAVLLSVNKKLWGRRRVVAALSAKGYGREDVEATFDRLLSRGEIDPREACRRLLAKCPSPDPQKRRAYLYRYGHGTEKDEC